MEAKARRETIESGRTLPSAWQVGMRIESKYQAAKYGSFSTKWYAGTIVSAPDADGRCDVRYDDGDFEEAVPSRYIRPPKVSEAGSQAPPAPTPAPPPQLPPPPRASTSPPSAGADDAADLVVSGKRKVKATVVQVDGHWVKRQNLYDMEEGEGSVWDRELSKKSDPAFEYKERAAMAAPVAKKAKVSAPRTQSADEKRRRAQNDEMMRAKDEKKVSRAQFLEPHREVLTRFGATIPAGGAASGGDGFVEDLAIRQPKEIGVEMREYQVRGLRWLVAMHDVGVNAILADEMGLGKTLQVCAIARRLGHRTTRTTPGHRTTRTTPRPSHHAHHASAIALPSQGPRRPTWWPPRPLLAFAFGPSPALGST